MITTMKQEVKLLIMGAHEKLISECDGIPKRKAKMFPSHRDDFFGVMVLAVAQAISNYGEQVSTPFVRTIVGRQCSELVATIPVVRIPPTTGRRLRKKDMDTMVKTEQVQDDLYAPETFNEAEIIDTICRTERERKIIDMRLDGFSYSTIANHLGISHQRVSQIMSVIRKRFNDSRSIS